MRGVEKPRNPGMLLSPGDLSHTSILYMEIPVLISHWVYLIFIESENELYDSHNFAHDDHRHITTMLET
jgi:hypothetical protein